MYAKKTVLFVDTVCPKPYDPKVLATEGLGGTEATVVRVAERLGASHPVTVVQHNRKTNTMTHSAFYLPVSQQNLEQRYHAVVAIRAPQLALNLKKFHKDTPVWLWLHDLVNDDFWPYLSALGEANVGIIVVSGFHRMQLADLMKKHQGDIKKFPRTVVLYNPVDDTLAPDDTKVDPNKLVFFSSPHKGLDYTLRMHQIARNFNPEFKLYVSNPGYIEGHPNLAHYPGVVDLGVLTHAEIIKHVRSALCVFYPNHTFPETFGLVLAEANAVGTPVLAHPFGAASEVLNGTFQTVDTRNSRDLVNKLISWYDGGRPKVTGKESFKISTVIKGWADILRTG